MQPTYITPTPRQLRALTHPVRLRMLGLLRTEGPATSTTLAARLGLNTGATSYHLRQLAEHGFIVDDAERGTGRERWWRAGHAATRTAETPGTGPDGSADTGEAEQDLDAYLQTVVTVHTGQVQRSIEERALLPTPWRAATTYSDYQRRLTPAQARVLLDRLDELLSEIGEDASPDDPEAAAYSVQINAFPQPGRIAEDPS